MAEISTISLMHVQLLPDKPKRPRDYQFKDLEQHRRYSISKNQTNFRTSSKVGDHAILFKLTGNVNDRYVVINDFDYAHNFYKWVIKHNPSAISFISWPQKLSKL